MIDGIKGFDIEYVKEKGGPSRAMISLSRHPDEDEVEKA